MGFAGNLKTVSFGDALQLISTGKKTGALHLNRGKRGKQIFFRQGNIVAALSDPPNDDERLGQMLIRRGKLSPDDLKRALKRQRASRKHLGQILIDLKILNSDEVTVTLRAQVEEVAFSIFGWPDGDFHFAEDEEPADFHVTVELNTLNVMMEGARRFDEYLQIAHVLPDEETVLRLIPTPKISDDGVTLSAADFEVLAAIDGHRSIGQIVGATMQGEYAAMKTLHKILKEELVEPCPDQADAARGRADEEEICTIIYKMYSRALATVHKQLSDQYGQAGDRMFMRIPGGKSKDPSEIAQVLMADGDCLDDFHHAADQIPAPLRLHRMLGVACEILSEAVRVLTDGMGSGPAGRIIDVIEKDLAFSIVQNRSLVERYDVRRDFIQALKGTERL